MKTNFPDFIFWGTDKFAVTVLKTLEELGIKPKLIVTTPDKPKGKYLLVSPPPVKVWSEEHSVSFIQPTKLSSEELLVDLKKINADVSLVASYGRLIPEKILSIPKFGTLNLHPSLLPKYRGPSPIQSAILDGLEETGVSLMLLDAELDHGPVLAQVKITIKDEPFAKVRDDLAKAGGKLFADKLKDWVNSKISGNEQNHSLATFTPKIKKDDGLIDPAGSAVINYRKFLAYSDWPQTFFFISRNGRQTRVIITVARLVDEQFVIDKVKPEGKKEMLWTDFLRGFK